MTGYSRSPRVHKGAIIGLDKFNPLASIVVFQYNPENLTRSLSARTSGEDANPDEAMRIQAPPREEIAVTLELDAADQLETGEGMAGQLGLHAALASLEMLLFPKALSVLANEILMAAGTVEVIPPEAPLTLFYWGLKRVLPVRITSLSIREEHFDPDLNPILAEVDLTMTVLTYHELGLPSVGGALYMAHQLLKEGMATAQGITEVGNAIAGAIDPSGGAG